MKAPFKVSSISLDGEKFVPTTKVNQYKFKNKKVIEVSFFQNQGKERNKKVPIVDCIVLRYSLDGGKTISDGLYMRPDEALMIAKQLIDIVYKVTDSYNIKLLKGYYGYKEFKL